MCMWQLRKPQRDADIGGTRVPLESTEVPFFFSACKGQEEGKGIESGRQGGSLASSRSQESWIGFLKRAMSILGSQPSYLGFWERGAASKTTRKEEPCGICQGQLVTGLAVLATHT